MNSQQSGNQSKVLIHLNSEKTLVDVVTQSISSDASIEDVMAWLTERIPSIANGWAASEEYSTLQKIRGQYEFKRGLPWIGRLAERTDNGLEEWIMVEKVTDTVLCMDPYPWDDVDEEFAVDLLRFLLRWQLAGSVAIHLSSSPLILIEDSHGPQNAHQIDAMRTIG